MLGLVDLSCVASQLLHSVRGRVFRYSEAAHVIVVKLASCLCSRAYTKKTRSDHLALTAGAAQNVIDN
jgi:hypothetical protein